MTHASVFSGIGGPEVAASMLGWENLFHCEINPFGRAVLDFWYPNAKSYDDITKTDFSEWEGQINVLTGGFPCQPFSVAGQRRGAEDDRYLWPHMHRCICEVRPDWVVCENVGGILSMVEQGSVLEVASETALFGAEDTVHRYEYRGTFTLERISRDLEADGYTVQSVLIPACAVGAPHRRDRVFIVGRRITADTRRGGQPASEQQYQRAGQTLQPQGGVKPLDGLGGFSPASSAADTCNAGLQETRTEQPTAGDWRPDIWLGEWVKGLSDVEVAGCDRWRDFPSVSPVHRGDDGLPFDVDDLTIPFSHWKNESIKAYGNAIVPQVMYEIFRAIELTENHLNKI